MSKIRISRLPLLLSLLALSVSAASGQLNATTPSSLPTATLPHWVKLAKLTPSDCGNCDFAVTVATSGDTVVASGGESLPEAYVYVKPASGWADMTETAKLTDSDGAALWSAAVSSDGNTVVAGTGTHTAYVFVKPTGGWVDMTETATLTPSDGGTEYGWSVSISGDTVVVGDLAGVAAYVFVKPDGGWTNMTETAKLTGSHQYAGDSFQSVGISGDSVVVGKDNYHHPDRSAAYVFVKPPSGWTNMTETAKLTVSYPRSDFAHAVSIAGDTITASDPGATIGTHVAQGAVYVFVKPSGGWVDMKETGRLTVASGKTGDEFGWPWIAITPTRIAALSWQAASVYVFHKPATGWKTTNKFNSRLPIGGIYSVAVTDNPPTLVGGRRETAAFVFGRSK